MFGLNPIRKPLNNSGDNLEIQEIFPTIQGEGPFAGMPAIFIRLGGCNLACNFCDTEFESFNLTSLEKILFTVKEQSNKDNIVTTKLVVVTGGEPFRQPIEKLVDLLIEDNYLVQIETNGSLYRDINKEAKIICSPKNNGKGYHKIREDLLVRTNAFKFIISKFDKDYTFVPEVGQKDYNIPVYVQPMDEYDKRKNKENLDYTVKLATQYNYNLSLQIHKYIGVR